MSFKLLFFFKYIKIYIKVSIINIKIYNNVNIFSPN